jgi:hypothetical protein
MLDLPENASFSALVRREFLTCISNLRRVKFTVNNEERQLMLLQTRALAHLLSGRSQVFLSSEITNMAMIIKGIVEFESPRVLIQEVSSNYQNNN